MILHGIRTRATCRATTASSAMPSSARTCMRADASGRNFSVSMPLTIISNRLRPKAVLAMEDDAGLRIGDDDVDLARQPAHSSG